MTSAELLATGAREFCSPDAMSAAAAHVEREYGYGYSIGIITGAFGAAYFEVVASDGGRFALYANRYGDVERV